MNKIIAGFLILLLPTSGYTQYVEGNLIGYYKHFNLLAEQQINLLHNGALLVRLKTKRNSIEALRKNGSSKLADKIELQQATLNKRIINAFRSSFDFCPVYFFFSDFSQQISQREFEWVVFLNDSLQPDTTIKFEKKDFLTAEFGIIEQDTIEYFKGYYNVRGENGLEKRTQYYGSPNPRFKVLAIKSDYFIQLRAPFPFYVRTYSLMPSQKKSSKVVKRINKRLHQFYEHKSK